MKKTIKDGDKVWVVMMRQINGTSWSAHYVHPLRCVVLDYYGTPYARVEPDNFDHRNENWWFRSKRDAVAEAKRLNREAISVLKRCIDELGSVTPKPAKKIR